VLEVEVGTVVGGMANGNIFPYRLPEGTAFPAVDFVYFEGSPIQSQTSYFRNPRLRFGIWAQTFDDMLTIFHSLLDLLDHHTGTFSALFEGAQDIPDPETGLFHRIVDFYLWGN
jgi:hypothetical protein